MTPPGPTEPPAGSTSARADIPKAIGFYASLFGWNIEQGGRRRSAATRWPGSTAGTSAGIGPIMGPPGTPSTWTTYFASPTPTPPRPRSPAPAASSLTARWTSWTSGRLVVAADVTGAVFGVWQARNHTGVQVANVPGAFTWSEHMSRDFEGAKAFYAAVFGYEYGDMSSDGFSYATLLINGQQVVGGIGAFPAGQGDDATRRSGRCTSAPPTPTRRSTGDQQRRPGDPPRHRQPLRPDGGRGRPAGRGLQPHLHPRRRIAARYRS